MENLIIPLSPPLAKGGWRDFTDKGGKHFEK
jgi:hypothetical protein